MGGLTGVQTLYIEEINIHINKSITYQSPAHTYGAEGARTNLHVAILAYDPTLHKVVIRAAALVFLVTDMSAAAVAYCTAVAASTVGSNQMVIDGVFHSEHYHVFLGSAWCASRRACAPHKR